MRQTTQIPSKFLRIRSWHTDGQWRVPEFLFFFKLRIHKIMYYCHCKNSKGAEPEFRSPRVRQLWDKWRTVWLLAWERQRRLHERLAHLKELQRVSNFSWDDWRKRVRRFVHEILHHYFSELFLATFSLMGCNISDYFRRHCSFFEMLRFIIYIKWWWFY